jgi:hypothetical protein
MRSILEELFYGNICPNTDCRSKDEETKQLLGYIADHHDNLSETLTDKQKEILEKFEECYNELTNIDALADSYRLVQVNVYGNDIDTVAELTAHDIIVNYDPT